MKTKPLRHGLGPYALVFLAGLLAGVATRLTDFCDGGSLWGFHAVATLFGFWIISVTAIVLLSASNLCAAISTFLYLFGMTTSFYALRYFLDAQVFRYEDAAFPSGLFFLYAALSLACGAGAFILYAWEKKSRWGAVLYALPVGALLAESLGVAAYLAGHGTYLSQLLLDLAGALYFGLLFYRRTAYRPLYLAAVCAVAVIVYGVVYRPFL